MTEISRDEFSFIVKWSGQEIKITQEDVVLTDNLKHLKNILHKRTGVLPERQKLLGLKVNGKPASDDHRITELRLKPNVKIMMMGSKEKDIEAASKDVAEEGFSVVDDFDLPEDVVVPPAEREEYQRKIQRRVKEYNIEILNPPRPGKKLLVLDIDYTLFDHRSVAENAHQLMRPYLHEFLESAYQDYDIVIWSATSMKWIQVKMRELGVANSPLFKICFYLDSGAMINIHTPKYGLLDVKPLGVIWGKFDHYTPKNTIMFDDIRRNFLMNPQNGLTIKPYKDAKNSRLVDRELLYLLRYLKNIASVDDLTGLNHKHWYRNMD